jgi:hypothetical protein
MVQDISAEDDVKGAGLKGKIGSVTKHHAGIPLRRQRTLDASRFTIGPDHCGAPAAQTPAVMTRTAADVEDAGAIQRYEKL